MPSGLFVGLGSVLLAVELGQDVIERIRVACDEILIGLCETVRHEMRDKLRRERSETLAG